MSRAPEYAASRQKGPGQAGFVHLGAALLSEPPASAHAVQFYDDETFLLETVAFFVSAGLAAGDAALVVATPAHAEGILAHLAEDDRERALAVGQLLLVDAEAMLDRFMRDGEPVEALFEAAVARVFEGVFPSRSRDGAAPPRVRAFGEMVDLLQKRGNTPAALQLEELWNRVCARRDVVLLCGYGMRNFYKAEDAASFGEVCRLHTHVMPTEHFVKDSADSFDRLRDISVLEQRARSLESEVAYREELECALRATLGARGELEPDPFGSIEPLRGVAAFRRVEPLRRVEPQRFVEPLGSVDPLRSVVPRRFVIPQRFVEPLRRVVPHRLVAPLRRVVPRRLAAPLRSAVSSLRRAVGSARARLSRSSRRRS